MPCWRPGGSANTSPTRWSSETRHLDAEHRRQVDKQIGDGGIGRAVGPRGAAAVARRCAYEADPAAYVARGRTARADRRVGLRPAPDTMSVLSGLLPVEQGVACLAALRTHTDRSSPPATPARRDQIMADTLVERVTGQARATDVNVEVGIVLPADALLDPDAGGAAEVTGHGPIPAGIAHDMLAATRGRRWWRRLFTAPRRAWSAATPVGAGSTARWRTDPHPRRRPLPRSVLRRPDPPPRPHPPPPRGRADQPGQRARGVRPRQLRARNAGLAGRARPRRPRTTIRTPCAPPRRPGTPTSAEQARLLGVFPIPRGDGEH